MKTLTLIIGVLLMFVQTSNAQMFKKLTASEVDQKKLEFTQKFANDYLTKQKNGSWYQFQDEAIDQLKSQMTEQTQKMIYRQLKTQFGDFQSLEFAEVCTISNAAGIYIYRFKGTFDKSTEKLEVRVVLNDSGKIAGFFIKLWADTLQ